MVIAVKAAQALPLAQKSVGHCEANASAAAAHTLHNAPVLCLTSLATGERASECNEAPRHIIKQC